MAKAFPNTGVTTGLAADRTALTSPFAGMQFFETNTNKLWVYNGSLWLQARPETSFNSSEINVNSTAYTNVSNTTPSVTLVTGTEVLLSISLNVGGGTTGAFIYTSYTVSGATTISGDDSRALTFTNPAGGAGQRYRLQGLFPVTVTAGTNTFQIVQRATSGSSVIGNAVISVQNLI